MLFEDSARHTAPQAMAGTSKPFCMFLAPPLVCLLSRHCNDVLIVPIMQPSSKGTEHSALDLGRRVAELGLPLLHSWDWQLVLLHGQASDETKRGSLNSTTVDYIACRQALLSQPAS